MLDKQEEKMANSEARGVARSHAMKGPMGYMKNMGPSALKSFKLVET